MDSKKAFIQSLLQKLLSDQEFATHFNELVRGDADDLPSQIETLCKAAALDLNSETIDLIKTIDWKSSNLSKELQRRVTK